MKTRIYDNGGETCDRYTVVIGSDIYGMSDNAMAPNGFNMYAGTIGECGYTGDFGLPAVKLADLPEQVQRAVALRVDSYLTEDQQ